MSNSYFKFKQFVIHQNGCAMKVCTDACLFGAWVADRIQSAVFSPQSAVFSSQSVEKKSDRVNRGFEAENILDIGTGTGLLSLMIAQKSDAIIDAIEIEENAFLQAKNNAASSRWTQRLNIIHADVRKYNFEKQYGLIVSNPPFFEKDLRSDVVVRNMARHDESLTFTQLFQISADHLWSGGLIAVMVPYHRTGDCKAIADLLGYHLEEEVSVRQSSSHAYFRSILVFGKQLPGMIRQEALVIKNGDTYSKEFVALLKDYYLNF